MKNKEENAISTYGISTLSEDLLKVTVLCYRVSINGEWQYVFFPSFKWLKLGYSVDNDSFAFALYSGWEVVPEYTPTLTVNLVFQNDVLKSKAYRPTNASEYGYNFNIQWQTGLRIGSYEGNTMFYARKKDTNATAGISVKYVYDDSWNYNISYGITIGDGVVAVSSTNKNLYVYAKNLPFNYK